MTRIDRTHFPYLGAITLAYVIDPMAFSSQVAGVPKRPFGVALWIPIVFFALFLSEPLCR